MCYFGGPAESAPWPGTPVVVLSAWPSWLGTRDTVCEADQHAQATHGWHINISRSTWADMVDPFWGSFEWQVFKSYLFAMPFTNCNLLGWSSQYIPMTSIVVRGVATVLSRSLRWTCPDPSRSHPSNGWGLSKAMRLCLGQGGWVPQMEATLGKAWGEDDP